ncbi:MAG: molecular chaperone [Alphaproteobacteria bacterium]|nr:molecular chaperone [Alphaproteobacteria bacterium]
MNLGQAGALPAGDAATPFIVGDCQVRGRLVRLDASIEAVLSQHDYPRPVSALLAELMAIAVALGGAFKAEAAFKLQIAGDGPISLMVADVTADGRVRGYARFDAARVAAVAPGAVAERPVPALLGAGTLAFTIETADESPYQGIVALGGARLADSLHTYFRQSLQFKAALGVALRVPAAGMRGWLAAAWMIERLPVAREPLTLSEVSALDAEALEDAWRRALALMASATRVELTDAALAPESLLYRLFHQEGLRVYAARHLRFGCNCSQERVESLLRSFPPAEFDDMKVDGRVVVTCQFCSRDYRFDDTALAELTNA